MIIQHNSKEQIDSVKSFCIYGGPHRGCLFFGHEGHDYNLAGEVNHAYTIEVNEDKLIDVESFFYQHSHDDDAVKAVLEDMIEDLGLSIDIEEASEILDETNNISDYETDDDAIAGWIVQQYQGILAHKLGYDCAVSHDEQGTVYVAYCVDRKLNEIEVA